MQFRQFAYGLFVKGTGIGCFVEIKVAAEDLVGTFTAQYHLDAHRLDDTCQQIHRCGSTDGSYVVCLNEIDNIPDGIEPFLKGVVYFMMNRTDVFGYFTCFDQVRCTFQSDGKGVQLRPPCIARAIGFNAFGGILFGNGRDNRTVQPARKKHSVRYVGHQLTVYGILKGVLNLPGGRPAVRLLVVLLFIFHPVTGVPAFHRPLLAVIVVSG